MNKQIIVSAKRIIDARRMQAVDKCEQLLEELRTHADFRECEKELKSAQVAYTIGRKSSEKATVEKLKGELKSILHKYGVTERDLLPKYSCPKCQDTGYVNGNACSCLQQEIRNVLFNESNVTSKDFTFENSTETNKHNLAVYKKAKEVCDGGKLRNILLVSNPGHGKTYLLSACANYCISLNKSVIFTTAYNLSTLFLECHLGNLATKQMILNSLTDVDVLVIDDLGTENVYKTVTAEYMFSLLNERIAQNRQTFISSNLTLEDLRDKYDERIFSRILDQNTTLVASLEGASKRFGF